MKSQIKLGDRKIGTGTPCFIIAEAGVNHNGELAKAFELIDVAVEAGVDAVKFQVFQSDQLLLPMAQKAEYQVEATGGEETQYDMLRRVELSFDAFTELKKYCDRRNIIFLASPFGESSIDFLFNIGVVAYKIPSGEITNLPFIENIASRGKPIIMSTGMSDLGEVEEALRVISTTGNEEIVLLHCVSAYPTPPVEVNLKAMQTLQAAFFTPVGFSDHTFGIEIPIAAVALGASVIEKHFTLSKDLPGPDHRASLEPDDLKQLVESIRNVESAIGDGRKAPTESEKGTRLAARRSIVTIRDKIAGEILEDRDLSLMRPGTGLPPSFIPYLLGRKLRNDLPAGKLITLDLLE